MLPTARNKMHHARLVTNGHSASTPRMTRFLFHEPDALRQNLENVADFIGLLDPSPEKPKEDGTLLWRQVDPNRVLSLVQGHLHHPEDRTFDVNTVEPYIRSRDLSNWSVALISTQDGRIDQPMLDYGVEIPMGLPVRTRIIGQDSIGELIQASNIVIDLPGSISDYSINGQVSYPLMYQHRSADNPLLLIYILDPESVPQRASESSRMPLFNEDQEAIPVAALAMALPVDQDETENTEEEIREFWTLQGMTHDD